MASVLQVEELRGSTTGANANKIIIPSGQTLDISDWSPPAGTVLQVQQSVVTTNQGVVTSTSYVGTGLSVTLTPKSATSSVIVLASINMDYETGINGSVAIFKDGVSLSEGSGTYDGAQYFNCVNNSRILTQQTVFAEDATTGTTSPIEYKIYMKAHTGGIYLRGDLAVSRIIAMEIAG